MDELVRRVGFWSATLMTLVVVLFAVALVITLVFSSFLYLSFVTSFFLTWAFVASMVSIHYYAPEDKKVWSHLGLSFAVMYAAMCSFVYYTQLVVVRTNPLNVSQDVLALFVFTPGSLTFAVDMLGYGFLTLAMLFAAPVFAGGRLERSIRWLFIVNGIFFIPTLLFPALLTSPLDTTSNAGVFALLFWCVVFAPASALLALLFRRAS